MIVIGADHAGYELKENIIEYLNIKGKKFLDVSNNPKDNSDDYPDIAKNICINTLKSNENIGIAICGTGIGISISCNKIKRIRAALCTDEEMAKYAKMHNNANVICFGARLKNSTKENIFNMLDIFFSSNFEEGRHKKRLNKISKLESGK